MRKKLRLVDVVLPDRYEVLLAALRDALVMLDASSFGGQKSYRCLTEFEVARLAEIRELVKPPVLTGAQETE